MNRISHSFLAAFLAWTLPTTLLFVVMSLQRQPGEGRIPDFDFFVGWPLLATIASWIVIALILKRRAETPQPPALLRIVAFCTAICLGCYLALAMAFFLFAPAGIILIWTMLIIAPLGGFLYWALQRTQPLRRWPFVFWALPIGAMVIHFWVLIPLALAYFPDQVYAHASSLVGDRAELEIVSRISKGDRLADIERDYPAFYEHRLKNATSIGYHSLNGGYDIEIDKTARMISHIAIERH